MGNANCAGVGVCSILLTVDSGVSATFRPNTLSALVGLSIFSGNGGGGTVRCSANGGVVGPCGSYSIGTTMVLTATPNAVSNFTGWSGAGCSGPGNCTFTLAGNTVVTANFNRPVLTAQLVGNGLVSSNPVGINSCVAICLAPFDKGSLVALTAAGVGFAGWSGGGCAGTGPCLVTVSQDSTVTATFNPVGLPTFAQQAYLKASNTRAQDQFGGSVALFGDTLVIGAPLEDSSATGVNGDQANNSAPESGAVYVFTQTGGVWSQEAYLKASDPEAADRFGASVALSADTLVVGAPLERSCATGVNGNQADFGCLGSGAAYVFTRTGGVWSQEAYLKASNTGVDDAFGHSVALSGDTLVVGAHFEDSDIFDNIVKSGTAYVFMRVGGVWSQEALLKASNTKAGDQFGWSVALSGDTLVAGANGESSCATGVNGNQAGTGCLGSGAAYVFTRTGGVWSQEAYLKASNSRQGYGFGGSVALSGDTLVAGATHDGSCATDVNGNQADTSCNASGAAYVFTRTGGVWSQEAYLKASNTGAGDSFGWSLALSGDKVVVGALFEDSSSTGVNGNQFFNNAGDSGAAYVFTRIGGIWSQRAYLKASNTEAGDYFGWNVALSGDTVVAGAAREGSNATGMNGNQVNNNAVNSGAAYVFIAQ
ncbi:MAG: integrin [Nitrospiraceae bacterium]|nr:integrin [Nitrospiraceae bacterium]